MCDFYMDKPTNDHQLTPFYIASERIWLSGFFSVPFAKTNAPEKQGTKNVILLKTWDHVSLTRLLFDQL